MSDVVIVLLCAVGVWALGYMQGRVEGWKEQDRNKKDGE